MTTFLRFRHLKQRRVVENWPQLKRLIEKHGFPPGRYFGPKTRVWTEAEIDTWTDSRPIAREDFGSADAA
jgi:predicted DNA-binding transcriptional regulator AlpA